MGTWFRRLFAQASPKKPQAEKTAANGISCQEVVEIVTDYLENALLPEKRVQLEEHVEGCEGCTNYIGQIRMTIGMLRNLAQEPVFPATREELLQVFRQWKNSEQ
ncbi:MAG TPA: zf-HC2 domain-containing protein [Ktedonobacteraceae bacterium]